MTAAFARSWRRPPTVSGPYPVLAEDVPMLNVVFSTAFTERYRKDGLVGVQVPYLNTAVWRFAIEDAAEGAMLWRGERDEVVAFNFCHRSGEEGWMGPLAVEPAYQGRGVGKQIVLAGMQWLRDHGARVIGLETMPRTMDNIGFYASLGFEPGPLTLTLTVDAAYAPHRMPQVSRLSGTAKTEMIARCALLTRDIMPGYDFTRELLLTDTMALGDTLVLERGASLDGFALCHAVPLVEGRVREELRLLKLVARTPEDFDELIVQLADYARRCGARRVAIRMQGAYPDLFRRMIQQGARVRWSDLRMTAAGFSERRPEQGIVLSNWEI